jgi:hypothetical protein
MLRLGALIGGIVLCCYGHPIIGVILLAIAIFA